MAKKKAAHHDHAHHSGSTVLGKPTKLKVSTMVAVMALVALTGVVIIYKSFAAGEQLYVTLPGGSTQAYGSSVVVNVMENSGSTSVTAVEADITYDSTKLQYVRTTMNNDPNVGAVTSDFNISSPSLIVQSPGSVKIGAASSPALTNAHIVAQITFTAIGTGTTSIGYANTSGFTTPSNTSQQAFPIMTASSLTIADTTAPTTPTGVTAGTKTVNSIPLTWTASTDNVGVVGYKIFRNGTQVNTSATASYTDTGLTANTSYTYTVAAYDAAGNTSPQSTALVTSTPPDTSAPTVPTNLAAGTKTVTTIPLTWTASTDNIGVTGYKVFRNGTQIATSATTSYTATGLTPNTSYTFTVAAFDAAGNTSAQTAGLVTSTPADTSAPSVPTGLTSPSQTTSTINLSWTASTDNVAVTGYKIFRNGTQVGTSATTAFTDTGLVQHTTYNYTIAAYDAAGNTSAQTSASTFSTATKQGDINSDGRVDITDLGILATSYRTCSKTFAQGDLSGDGCVDIVDLGILAQFWGS